LRPVSLLHDLGDEHTGILRTGLARAALPFGAYLHGRDATSRFWLPRAGAKPGRLSRSREFSSMVGTPGELAELSRSMVIGRIRAVFRKSLRGVSRKSEGIFAKHP